MSNWHFAPWTIQYIIGILIVSYILVRLLQKKLNSIVYQVFYTFCFATILWQLFMFLHRNVGSKELSKIFFGLDLFFASLLIPLILLMYLFLNADKKIYLLIPIPAFILGYLIIINEPYQIVWAGGSKGWSFKFTSTPYLFYAAFIYLIITVYIGLKLIASSKGIGRKKYILITAGLFIAGTGVIVSNFCITQNPNIPPLAGFFVIVLVSIIGYAIALPEKPIVVANSLGNIGKSYYLFLNRLKHVIPGHELGESSIRFWDYANVLNMNDMIEKEEAGEIIFRPQNLDSTRIQKIANNIINEIKNCTWSKKIIDEIETVLLSTYNTLEEESDKMAQIWFEDLIKENGEFILRNGLLKEFPDNLVPQILQELNLDTRQIFYEKSNFDYSKIEKAVQYKIKSSFITKYNPHTLRQRFNCENVNMIWVTFKESTKFHTISPKNKHKLQKILIELCRVEQNRVILIDCLKEIWMANGIEILYEIATTIHDLCIKNMVKIYIVDNFYYLTKKEKQKFLENINIKNAHFAEYAPDL